MEYGCPVCNGFMSIGEICPNCSKVMEDTGRIEDFYTPYSPYEEQDQILILQESSENCIHLFLCTHCDRTEQIMIPLEVM